MTRAERLLTVLLAITVLVSPVFLGGVSGFRRDWTGSEPSSFERFLWADGGWWTLLLLGSAVAGTSLVVSAERARAGEPPAWRLHGALLLPFAGLLVLAILQSLPLPRGLHGLLDPSVARDLDRLVPGDASWRPLTLSPGGTRGALLGLSLGGAVLLGTLLAARQRAAAWWLCGSVVLAFAGSAAYGLYQQYLGDDMVLAFKKRPGLGVTGTFINRSHMAAGAGMALALGLAMTGCLLRPEGARWKGLVIAAAAVLLAVTIPLTNSRMGLASGAVGIVALGLLGARASRWPLWGRALVVVGALAVAGGGAIYAVKQLPALRERFALQMQTKGAFDIRVPAWEATVKLAARHPVLGAGVGAYEVAIHETQDARNPDELVYAHSEPLHLLSEGGVVGLFLSVLLAAGAVAGALKAANSDDSSVRMLACGCGGALAALLAGCTTEFHLHIPALGIAAAVIAAVPLALLAGEPRAPEGKAPRWLVPVAGVLVLLVAPLGALDGARAGSARRAAFLSEQARTTAAWLEASAAWTRAAPRDAAAWRSRAMALLEDGAPGTLAERAAESLAAADRAVDLEPFHPYTHWSRAVALLALDRMPDAVPAMEAALSRAGGIGHLHLAAGSVMLHLSVEHPDLRPRALAVLREAGRIHPHHYSAAVKLAGELGVPESEQAELVPRR